MKNILIPIDFSLNARNALIYALRLFDNEECTFYLLHAFQLDHYTKHSLTLPDPESPTYEQVKEESEESLEKLIDGIEGETDCSNYHFEIIASYNSVLEAVKQFVEKKDISLIVMGTKGETNASNILFGGNAVNIMEKIQQCPILVVPKDSVFLKETKKEIVVATNFQSSYKYKEIQSLLSIAQNIKAVVRILHILENGKLTPEQEAHKEVLKDYLNGIEYTFHTLTHTKVADGIQSFIEGRGIEMLALTHKKQNFLNSIFSRSLLKEIGYKPQIPVFVMHDLNN